MMVHDIRAVLFDLDGTLIDSAPDLAGAANELRAAHGLPALPRVAFQFLPPRRGESAFVTRARELLASQLV